MFSGFELYSRWVPLMSSLVGYFKKTNAFLVYFICLTCFSEIVRHEWCLHKSVRQTENGLERGFY